MLHAVDLGWRDFLRERHRLSRDPRHSDTTKLEPFHRMHGRQPYTVLGRCWVVLHSHRPYSGRGQRLGDPVQQEVESSAHRDLAAVDPAGQPLLHLATRAATSSCSLA